MEEVRLHRAHARSQDPRHFLVGELVVDLQDQRRALAVGQPRHRLADAARLLPLLHRLHHRGRRVGQRLRQLLLHHPLGGAEVQARVHRDPVQPGGERAVPAEAADGTIRLQERVLRQVARVLVVADETVAELIDRAAMAFDDHIEGLATTGQERRHQGAIIGRSEVVGDG